MKKKVILQVESVYTANAFQVGSEYYIAAGSETKPEVFLYNLHTGSSSLVKGCPGGVMSFIPTPGSPDLFFSIMGLFPPFIGADAGVFMHRRSGEEWSTNKVLALPFAHRCEIINRKGVNYLLAASVSKDKENPQDWSLPGEMHLIRFDDDFKHPKASEIIDSSITRNHGMLRTSIEGVETICISGAEGIFYFWQTQEDKWILKPIFDKEVSEFCFIDLDGDGEQELITIEPFHGESLNVYKQKGKRWELKYSNSLSFGHGLSCGFINSEPVIIVGNRRGSFTLDQFKVIDLLSGKFTREVIEEDAGPTQTQVFTARSIDYILSSNQKKNEVALYY